MSIVSMLAMLFSAKYSVRIFFYSSSLLKYIISDRPVLSLSEYVTKSLRCHVVCLGVEETFTLKYIWNAHQHVAMLIPPWWYKRWSQSSSRMPETTFEDFQLKPRIKFWPSVETEDSFGGSLNIHWNIYFVHIGLKYISKMWLRMFQIYNLL